MPKGAVRYVFELLSNAYEGYWIDNVRRYTMVSDDVEIEEEVWLVFEKKVFSTRAGAWAYAVELISKDKGE